MMKKFLKQTLLCTLFCIFALCLTAGLTNEKAFAAEGSEPEYTSFSDLDGKTVGMVTGAPFEELIKKKCDPKEVLYFSAMADMALALEAHKIDAFLMNDAVGTLSVNTDSTKAFFPEILGETSYGIAFTKGKELRKTWQKTFDEIDKSEIENVWKKWTDSDESAKKVPAQDWPGKNGEVKVAACDTLPPMSYVGENGELQGFDIEIILMIAKKLDVHVKFTGMEFSSIMPEVQSGKSDMGCGSILVNDERKEMVDFIEHYPGSFRLIVRSKATSTTDSGFFSEIKDSFARTFIRDGRWKLIFSGLGMTLLMSGLAACVGFFLGLALLHLHRKNLRVINAIIKCYNTLIAGLPVVVILMLLYYVVFGNISLPAFLVAAIGFSLVFGSRVFTTMHSAVQSVDIGQQEAAYALGYPDKLAFKRIILPQAKDVYVPILQSQFIMLVKETSVAGFITVLDLTRAGDLIRSRTMEAFFPLISIAIFYFLLTWLLTLILKRIQQRSANKKTEK